MFRLTHSTAIRPTRRCHRCDMSRMAPCPVEWWRACK